MYQGLIINLLSRAAWKKGSYQGREILPGQFGAVMSHLAESLGVPRSTLQRMVAHLEADDFLKVENVGNRFVIITVVNWSIYQEPEKDAWAAGGQPTGAQRAAGGQPSYKEEEVKKVRRKAQESYDSSPEQSSIAAGSAAEKPLDAVITLTLNTGEEHPVTQGEIDQWKDLYPSVDVLQALRNMKGWLIGNAKRRKTKAGIGRFIQAWLANAQDNPRASPSARIGPSRHGNAYADGRERDYGQSDFGALGGGK